VFDVTGAVKDGGLTRDMHQRGTVFCNPFLSSEGVKPIEILRRMKTQFVEACLSLQQMYEWDRKLNNVVSSVADAEYTGCPYTAYTPETVEYIERVIQGKNLVTTVEVALQLCISYGSAHHIMHDVLQYHKVCAR
jgi:hypothetical protein